MPYKVASFQSTFRRSDSTSQSRLPLTRSNADASTRLKENDDSCVLDTLLARHYIWTIKTAGVVIGHVVVIERNIISRDKEEILLEKDRGHAIKKVIDRPENKVTKNHINRKTIV